VDDTTTPFFNPFDPEFHRNPYGQYKSLRERSPVLRGPFGLNILFTYEDVSRVLRGTAFSINDPRGFSSMPEFQLESVFGEWAERGAHTILNLDPPDHTRLRGLLSSAFTSRVIETLRDDVERLVNNAIDGMVANQHDTGQPCDAIDRLAVPVPFAVISDLIGLPEHGRDDLRAWSHTLTKALEPIVLPDEAAAIREAGDEILGYVTELVSWKRRNMSEDLLSGLLIAEQAGERLTDDELVDQLILLFIAGHETVASLIGNGILNLIEQPEQFDLLRNSPTPKRGLAVEELLRYDAPVQFARRIALEEGTISGEAIVPGDRLILCLGSANRDPKRFGSDAHQLRLDRAQATEHLAFGNGIHYCLGAALARLEGQIVFGLLAERCRRIELGTAEAHWNGRVVLRSLAELPLVLHLT
jgi:cytochrome P450